MKLQPQLYRGSRFTAGYVSRNRSSIGRWGCHARGEERRASRSESNDESNRRAISNRKITTLDELDDVSTGWIDSLSLSLNSSGHIRTDRETEKRAKIQIRAREPWRTAILILFKPVMRRIRRNPSCLRHRVSLNRRLRLQVHRRRIFARKRGIVQANCQMNT